MWITYIGLLLGSRYNESIRASEGVPGDGALRRERRAALGDAFVEDVEISRLERPTGTAWSMNGFASSGILDAIALALSKCVLATLATSCATFLTPSLGSMR